MHNSATIVGRIARPPRYQAFKDGGVCKIRVLTSRSWRDRATGEFRERVEGHNVGVYIDKIARRLADSWITGDLVLIEGAMETRRWTDSEGTQRQITEIALRPWGGRAKRLNSASARHQSSESDEGSQSHAQVNSHPDQASSTLADPDADVFDNWLSEDLDALEDAFADLTG